MKAQKEILESIKKQTGYDPVMVDITSIHEWAQERGMWAEDLRDKNIFPTLTNPFDVAIWRVVNSVGSDYYVISETVKRKDHYESWYKTYFMEIGSNFLLNKIAVQYDFQGNYKDSEFSPVISKITEFVQKDPNGTEEQKRAFVTNNRYFFIVHHAINLIHCKNIELRDEPLTRQQRRYKKRKGETTYKVLTIKEGDKSYRYLDYNKGNGQNAMHLCRGHFRTYTDDAPLFGRVTGTFWIPQHVRGAKENGEIIKDYRVEK